MPPLLPQEPHTANVPPKSEALHTLSPRPHPIQAIAQFCLLAVVGMVLGIAFGAATSWLLDNIFRDPTLTTIVTLMSAYASYYTADRLVGASGLLAVVCNGFAMSLIGVGCKGFAISLGIGSNIEAAAGAHGAWDLLRGVADSTCHRARTSAHLRGPPRVSAADPCSPASSRASRRGAAPPLNQLVHRTKVRSTAPTAEPHRSAGGRQIALRAEEAMHGFWGVLEWGANTILFVWVGIVLAIVLPPSHEETVITDQPIHLVPSDAGYVVVLYIWLQVG